MSKRYGFVFAPVLLAAGCANQQVKPYKDALYRYGVAGQHIIEDIPAPTTDGGRARLDSFKEACDEAVKLGGK